MSKKIILRKPGVEKKLEKKERPEVDPYKTEIPLYEKGSANVVEAAKIDAEDYTRLSQYRWFYDPKFKVAYRDIKIGDKPKKMFLHREVLGCVFGDGNTVETRDGNKLNCKKSNVFISMVKDITTATDDKFFPRKKEIFVSLVRQKFPESFLSNLLDVVEISDYSTKKITFIVPEQEPEWTASVLAQRNAIHIFLKDNFNFRGDVFMIKKALPSTVKVISPVAVTNKQEALIRGMLDLLGAPPQNAPYIRHISFGMLQGDKVYNFSYSSEDINAN